MLVTGALHPQLLGMGWHSQPCRLGRKGGRGTEQGTERGDSSCVTFTQSQSTTKGKRSCTDFFLDAKQ